MPHKTGFGAPTGPVSRDATRKNRFPRAIRMPMIGTLAMSGTIATSGCNAASNSKIPDKATTLCAILNSASITATGRDRACDWTRCSASCSRLSSKNARSALSSFVCSKA